MSQKKANTYTAEFKESAVKLAVESDQSVTQTARELGINVNTLHTWISHHRRKNPGDTPRVDDEHLYHELKKLRRENARLKEEPKV
jgi:transposase